MSMAQASSAAMDTADVARFLKARRDAILDEAVARAHRMHLPHYQAEGSIEQRLPALYDLLVAAVASRDVGPIVAYCQGVAGARFTAGYDLSEVQTAFNVLEESTWSHAFEGLSPEDFAPAIVLIGTVFGAGKDALARAYVAHATRVRSKSVDLSRLFGGTDDPWLDF